MPAPRSTAPAALARSSCYASLVRSLSAFTLLLAASTVACQHVPHRDQDLAEARALFERNLAAIRDRDRDAYLACYRQDGELVRNGPTGPVWGFDGLAAGTSTVPASWPDSLTATDLALQWLGAGYVYGSYRYRVVYAGAAFEGISERVFTRAEGRWQIAVTTAFGSPASSDPRLDAVAFLTGHWSFTKDGRVTEETWSHARGGTMLGSARTFEGERTVSWEHLRIELDGEVLQLVAAPSGQATTTFRLEAQSPGRVVFQNLEHDFPQRIIYRRDGDKLHARIEGAGRSAEWTYERR